LCHLTEIEGCLAAVELLGYDSFAMQTKVSIKGQVVLPSAIRRQLGLRTGDSLDANAEGGRIVLTPRRRRAAKAKILLDPITGLPVLSAGPHDPLLSSKEVQAILSTFP
jgi:AbrB family looped-hinge helix DNA binding protein